MLRQVCGSGQSGNIYVSTNLTNWITANTGGGESHTGVCYGNGLYVAVGAYNGVFTSGDALHWIQKTCAPPASAGKIAYGTGFCFGTGLMSVDGTNWSGVTLPTT